MKPFYTILTNYGKTALAEALAAQKPLEIPRMAVGDGGGSYYEPVEEQTNLRNERWRGDLNDLRTDDELQGQVIAEAIIPHDIEDGDWTAREIGLFDAKGGLVAVGKYPETYIPSAISGAKSQVYINIIIKVDNVSAVELIINHDTVLASKQYVSNSTGALSESILKGDGSSIGIGGNQTLDTFVNSYKNIITFEMFGVDTDSTEDYTDKIEACIQYAMQNRRVIFCTGKVYQTSRTITLDAGGNAGRNNRLVMIGDFTIKPLGDFTGVILKRYLKIDSIKVLADHIKTAWAINSDDMYRSHIGSMTIDTEDGSISTGSGWRGNNIFLNNFGLTYIARVNMPVDIRKEFNANTVSNIEIHACSNVGYLGNMKGSTINVLTIEDAKNGGLITGGNIGSVINSLYLEFNKGVDFKIDHSHGFDGGTTSGLQIHQVMNFNNSNNTKVLPVIDIVDGGAEFGNVTFGGTNIDGYVGFNIGSQAVGGVKSVNGSGLISNSSGRFLIESLRPIIRGIYPNPSLNRNNPTPLRTATQVVFSHTLNQSVQYVRYRVFGGVTGGGAPNDAFLVAEIDANGAAGVLVIKESAHSSIGWVLSYNKATREVVLKCKPSSTTAQSCYLYIDEIG